MLSIFLMAALQGSELKAAGREVVEISINKTLFFYGLDVGELDRDLASSGHGDAEEDGVHVLACQAWDLQQGSSEAALGNESIEVLPLLSSKMVEGLPSSTPASVFPGRRLRVNINL
jgi:hypothetical protein